MSGDCYTFTIDFRDPETWHVQCDEYVACNQDRIEEFGLR